MNTQANESKNESKNDTVVDTLFDVGEAWASYGLKIAELALQTSARTLTNVSKVLGTLAEELNHVERREESQRGEVIDAPQS